MESGIKNWKDLVEMASFAFAGLSLVGIFISYLMSRKQIHFSAIEKCINDFRNLKGLKISAKYEVVCKYIDLVNEELFYLENDYLPLDIAIEWIDGMIDYLPFIYKGCICNPGKTFLIINSKEELGILLKNHPRVRKFIEIHREIDFNKIHDKEYNIRFVERSKLLIDIISNLKISSSNQIVLEDKVYNR